MALWLIPGLGPVGFKRLLERFDSPENIWSQDEKELRSVGVSPKVASAIVQKKTWARAEKELKSLEQKSIDLITFKSPLYPQTLLNINDAPPVLYLKGVFEPRAAIAIVGSRNPSSYGLQVAEELAQGLAREGLVIVSGAALGIDAAAHKGALKAGGTTWAVLGTGLDVPYPWRNRGLLEEISSQGAIISEFPLGTGPRRENFPIRNRLISGLSLGVVVVEAGPKSGSLITARLAADQGREVMAVPGSIYSFKSQGTHRLLKEGATLIESVEDILFALRIETSFKPPPAKDLALSPQAELVFEALEPYPMHLEELAHKIRLDISEIAGILLELELAGLVEALPGQQYQRRPQAVVGTQRESDGK
ncbi:DNA-processing protein DprA [Thermosulfuriphilus sp.]